MMSALLKVLLVFMLILLPSCGVKERPVYRIGLDATWYPLSLEGDQEGVNAFIRDLFLEISKVEQVDIELVYLSKENLMEALEGKVEACLTSLYPYNFNKAVYDFSQSIFSLSPILVVPLSSEIKKIEELFYKNASSVSESEGERILESYPEIFVQSTPYIATALNRVAQGMDVAALLDRMPTMNYVNNLYSEQLKIVPILFNEEGIRLIALKGKQDRVMAFFNRSFDSLKSSGKVDALEMKWGLKTLSR